MYDFLNLKNYMLKYLYINMLLENKKILNVFMKKKLIINIEYINYINFYMVYIFFFNFLKKNIYIYSNFINFKICYFQKLKNVSKKKEFLFDTFFTDILKRKKIKKNFYIFANNKIYTNIFFLFNSLKKLYVLKRINRNKKMKNVFFIKNFKYIKKKKDLNFFFDILKFFIAKQT